MARAREQRMGLRGGLRARVDAEKVVVSAVCARTVAM